MLLLPFDRFAYIKFILKNIGRALERYFASLRVSTCKKIMEVYPRFIHCAVQTCEKVNVRIIQLFVLNFRTTVVF